jgi:hypothetical protein
MAAPTSEGEASMATVAQSVHRFTLSLSGVAEELSFAELDRLYEAGCGDASIGCLAGNWFARFSREAPNLSDAIASAIENVEAAGVEGLRIDGVTAEEPPQSGTFEAAVLDYIDALLRMRRLAPRASDARALADRVLAEAN